MKGFIAWNECPVGMTWAGPFACVCNCLTAEDVWRDYKLHHTPDCQRNIAGCPKRAAASLQSTERLNELEKARYVRLHVSVPHPFHQIPP